MTHVLIVYNVFLEKLKSHWSVLLAIPPPVGIGSSDMNTDEVIDSTGTSLLGFLHTIHEVAPGEFVVARDKYRVIAAYAVSCVLEGMRVHCDSLILKAFTGNHSVLQEMMKYSRIIRDVIAYLLPVTAHENNPNIFQECLKVLQCGARHCGSQHNVFVVHADAKSTIPAADWEMLKDSAAACLASEHNINRVVMFRSLELHPLRVSSQSRALNELPQQWGLYASSPSVPMSARESESEGECERKAVEYDSILLKRSSNTILCATEALLFVANDRPFTARQDSMLMLARQPFRVCGVSAMTEYFEHITSEPTLSASNRYLNNSDASNWRGQDSGAASAQILHEGVGYAEASCFFGLLLDKCALLLRRSHVPAGPGAVDGGSTGDSQDQLTAAMHRAILAVFQVLYSIICSC
jgi:hypothetical protein